MSFIADKYQTNSNKGDAYPYLATVERFQDAEITFLHEEDETTCCPSRVDHRQHKGREASA